MLLRNNLLSPTLHYEWCHNSWRPFGVQDNTPLFQHSRNWLCSSLHFQSPVVPFQVMCKTSSNEDGTTCGKLMNTATEKPKERDLTSSTTGSNGAPGVVSGLVGDGTDRVVSLNFRNGIGVWQETEAGSQQGMLEEPSGCRPQP